MSSLNELENRRNAVYSKMDDESFALFFSGRAKYLSSTTFYPFEVNADFYYLTGIEQEGSSLLLIKRGGETRTILFIDQYDEAKRRWYGKRLSQEEARRISGINNVMLSAYLSSRLDRLLRQGIDEESPVNIGYFDLSPELKVDRELDAKAFASALQAVYPSLLVKPVRPLVAPLRKNKSDEELESMKKAISHVKDGLLSAYALLSPGVYEYDLGLAYLASCESTSGLSGLAEPLFIAQGSEANCLATRKMKEKVRKGQTVVFDVNARDEHYCAYIARTVPVDGKFNDRQSLVYSIVLECLRKTGALLRPLLSLDKVNEFARELLKERCLKEQIIVNPEEINLLTFPKVISFVGLELNEDYEGMTLQEGDVVALNVGLYLDKEDIAVRLKDMYSISSSGSRLLSEGIAIERDDLESHFKLKRGI